MTAAFDVHTVKAWRFFYNGFHVATAARTTHSIACFCPHAWFQRKITPGLRHRWLLGRPLLHEDNVAIGYAEKSKWDKANCEPRRQLKGENVLQIG